jgi:nicotinamide-nucleotide amidase
MSKLAKVAELITIGNEILDGRTLDTNRVYLGRHLKNLGYEVRYAQSVDDHLERIVEALNLAVSRSDIVLCTGGLGPTSDDLTSEAVAKFLNCSWQIQPQAEAFVQKRILSRGRQMNASQLKQAKLPSLCKMIENDIGTAPAFSFIGKTPTQPRKESELYFFPGVPRELKDIFEKLFIQKEKDKSLKTYTWSTLFTGESDLQEKLSAIEKNLAPLKLAFRTQFPQNHVSLMGYVQSEEEKKHWEASKEKISHELTSLSYREGSERKYEEVLVDTLKERSVRLLLVESCTGGLMSNLLTNVSGSSEILWGSQVTYANEEKLKLGVSPDTLKKHGAVSAECAKEMSQAGLRRLEQDESSSVKFLAALSITGIAGPTGGSAQKPVGLSFASLTLKNVQSAEILTFEEKIQSPPYFDRQANKLYSAMKAFELLRSHI